MKYTVTKSQIIKGQLTTISNYIADFNHWQSWSPWACIDPHAKIDCREDYLAWESKFTGIGSMTRLAKSTNAIIIALTFVKPFKSHAQVNFNLEQLDGNSCSVTWNMTSKLPFFLFFFKKMLQVMIGRDFERGLTRLRYLVERGSVPSTIEFFDTPEPIKEFTISGINASCSFNSIGSSMAQSFTKLTTLLNDAAITPINMACFYHKMNMRKEEMDYSATAIHNQKSIKKPNLFSKDIPNHQAIKVILHGSYDFMGDAWTGICMHMRGLKLKADKRVAPYDIYIKGPNETNNPDEYVTEIYFPVK